MKGVMNMEANDIYLQIDNVKQVKLWNLLGYLVKVKRVETIVETKTKKPVGYLVWLHKSLFKGFVSKRINGLWK